MQIIIHIVPACNHYNFQIVNVFTCLRPYKDRFIDDDAESKKYI